MFATASGLKLLASPRKWCTLLALLAMALPAPAQTLRNREEVRTFDSTISIRKDGTLLVRENITVRSLGIEIRHGIYREFAEADGRPATPVKVKEVLLDGTPASFREEETGTARRIYIGDPNMPLVTGEHTFSLTYQTPALVTQENGRDRLYWNVTGNSWALPITDISAKVQLPEGVPQDSITVEGYTGTYGATGKDYMFDLDTRGTVAFTAGPLRAKEGLIVSVDWPPGYVHHGWNVPLFLQEYSGLCVGIGGLFVLLLYWGLSWFYFGKDPAPGTITARANPPQGLSAAGMRYVTRMAVDNKAFAAGVVGLAAVGALRVEERSDDYVLVRTHADFHTLPPDERALAKALFGSVNEVSLKIHTRRIRKAMQAFRTALEAKYCKYFSTNEGFVAPALVMSAVFMLASLYFEIAATWREKLVPCAVALVCLAGCGWALHYMWPRSLREWKLAKGNAGAPLDPARRWVGLALAVAIAALLFGLGTAVGTLWTVLLMIVAGVNILFAHLTKRPTPAGRRMLDEVAGFRLYLRKISSGLMSCEFGDAKQRSIFERYMGYALALDMESDWARRFGSALAQEGGGNVVPAWYQGDDFQRFYLRGYFGAAATTARAAAAGGNELKI